MTKRWEGIYRRENSAKVTGYSFNVVIFLHKRNVFKILNYQPHLF